VQAAEARTGELIVRFGGAVGVLVAVFAPDALVAAGAKGPAAVFRGGAVAGEEHHAHVGALAGVIEGQVQLIHRLRAEGVAHLGPVEGDAHGALVLGAVVGDVLEIKAGNFIPPGRVENPRNGRVCLHDTPFNPRFSMGAR
jgi:hypothetical protein